jgi:hypothetical protein
MGAYYKATITETSYNPHDLGNGYKLMEHNYLDNNYCLAIENLLFHKPQPLVWLCDYHKPEDGNTQLTWDDTTEDSISEAPWEFEEAEHLFVVNHSKEIYYDKTIVNSLLKSDWKINPLPILTNSENEAAGGGDYYPDDSRRATWCGNDIATYYYREDFPEDFIDVSEDVLFYE